MRERFLVATTASAILDRATNDTQLPNVFTNTNIGDSLVCLEHRGSPWVGG